MAHDDVQHQRNVDNAHDPLEMPVTPRQHQSFFDDTRGRLHSSQSSTASLHEASRSSSVAQTPRRSSGEPSNLPPPSPSHGWFQEPAGIHEPLVLMDGIDGDAALELTRLRAELAEARALAKADRAALDALASSSEASQLALERDWGVVKAENLRFEQENEMLRLQLADHHGIMATEWAHAIDFQERLKTEQLDRNRLRREVAELREGLDAMTEEAVMLRQDAARWRIISSMDSLACISSCELDKVLDVITCALAPLHAEAYNRSRVVEKKLHSELEDQLCVVCRDAKKAVLFQPCLHVCVCESCRTRLHPYRCPLCQERVQSHIERIHF